MAIDPSRFPGELINVLTVEPDLTEAEQHGVRRDLGHLRVEQAQSFDLGEFAFDQARTDIPPITRIGHHYFVCKKVRGVPCSPNGRPHAGDDEGVTARTARNQHAVLQRYLTVMHMSQLVRREIAVE